MSAVDVQLAAVQFPDNKTVDLPLAPTTRVAPAFAEAEVRYRNGQAEVEVSYKKLPPAVLFSGDVTSYVVWVVARDGATENLGELIVRSQSGKGQYRTGQKEFGLLITAEAYPLVLKPSELVIFTSIAPPPKKASSTPVTLWELRPGSAHGQPHDRHDGVLRQGIPRPDPGPGRAAAGPADGRREVRARRDARREHLARPGHQLVQGRPENAGHGLRPPLRRPGLRRDPDDAAEGSRGRGRRGRRRARGADAVARTAENHGAEAGRRRPAGGARLARAGPAPRGEQAAQPPSSR